MNPCCRVCIVGCIGMLLVVGALPTVRGQPVDLQTGQRLRLRSPAPWTLPAPPTAEEQAQAEAVIEQLLSGRVDLNANDAAVICHELRDLARGTNDDVVARYVLLRWAYNRAMESNLFSLAGEVVDDLSRWYSMDELGMRAEVLTAAVEHRDPGATSTADELANALKLTESCLMADRIDLAQRVMALAQQVAEQSNEPAPKEQAARWSHIVHEWGEAAGQARHIALRLLQEPSDSGAQLALGRYLCFIKGDWARGLPRLARGNDESLRSFAQTELNTRADDTARIAVADGWRQLAAINDGLVRRRLLEHAEEIDRRIYPAVTGLTRLKLEQRMIGKPLLVFDSNDPPSGGWIEEHLHFRGGHGREGRGSWANIGDEGGGSVLVANRAGFIETLEHFPPPDVDHYEIEAELQSDIGNGTALEFGGQRMYLDRSDGLRMEGGWLPNVIYQIQGDRSDHYLIDVSPDGISFALNGVHLGTMPTDHLARGGIVLRGWEGHLRCRRLVVWALPSDDLSAPLPLPTLTASAPTIADLIAVDAGFQNDLRTMRQTVHFDGKTPVDASSGDAIAAAVRVFERFPEVGMTRTHVLAVLGDPKTISGYGIAAGDEPDAPLVYRFDAGFGGVQYTIHFQDDRVLRIETQHLE